MGARGGGGQTNNRGTVCARQRFAGLEDADVRSQLADGGFLKCDSGRLGGGNGVWIRVNEKERVYQ